MKCQHRLGIPDFPPNFWREVLDFEFGVFKKTANFNGFGAKFWILDFKNETADLELTKGGFGLVGGCLCGAHAHYLCKNAIYSRISRSTTRR